MPSNSTTETQAAASSFAGTATPSTASGKASTFMSSRVPNTISEAAVMPDAARPGETPSCESISYWSAADVAPPPGRSLLAALPTR